MKHPIVMVTWLDAVRTDSSISRKENPVECRTVGYLLALTDKKVVLAMDKNPGDGYRNGFAIPRGMVLEIVDLSVELAVAPADRAPA
jgi:hypothetical protein